MGGDGSKPGHGSIYSKMNKTIERKTECVHVGILKQRPTETRDMQSKGDGDEARIPKPCWTGRSRRNATTHARTEMQLRVAQQCKGNQYRAANERDAPV